MLKPEDLNIQKDDTVLTFRRFTDAEGDKEAVLLFCFNILRDDAWYEIEIGRCCDNDYVVLENHRFRSIKKVLKWWNEFFGGEDDV